jgi:hypothetical protein
MIGFPLSEREEKFIETVATQVPFGKGTIGTVVDTTVRDTLEIKPNKFSFNDPACQVEFFNADSRKECSHWAGFTSEQTPTAGGLVQITPVQGRFSVSLPSFLSYMYPLP